MNWKPITNPKPSGKVLLKGTNSHGKTRVLIWEWEELEYEKGGDDPMYGGVLVPMKFTRCGNCD